MCTDMEIKTGYLRYQRDQSRQILRKKQIWVVPNIHLHLKAFKKTKLCWKWCIGQTNTDAGMDEIFGPLCSSNLLRQEDWKRNKACHIQNCANIYWETKNAAIIFPMLTWGDMKTLNAGLNIVREFSISTVFTKQIISPPFLLLLFTFKEAQKVTRFYSKAVKLSSKLWSQFW